jgi:hypothetical protein
MRPGDCTCCAKCVGGECRQSPQCSRPTHLPDPEEESLVQEIISLLLFITPAWVVFWTLLVPTL